MHVFHTEGEPPNSGNNIFAISGCTQKSKPALVKSEAANTGVRDVTRIEGLYDADS
jgi:hypothetical protein